MVKTVKQDGTTSIRLPINIKQASLVNVFEELVENLNVKNNEVLIELVPDRITQILIIPEI